MLLYGPVVRYWIRRRGISSADEGDVFQEVFVAVHRQLPSFERAEGAAKFRAWLKTVALSKIADQFRGQGRRGGRAVGGTGAWQMLQDPAANPDAADGKSSDATRGNSTPTRQALQIVREEFSELHCHAFWRTAVDECSAVDVAVELGLSAVAVRKAKSRVLQRVREYLNEQEVSSASGNQPVE